MQHRSTGFESRGHRLLLPTLLVVLPMLAATATVVVVTHTPVSTTGTRTQEHTIRYEVTGAPGTRFSISYVSDSAGTVSNLIDQPVPWRADTTLYPVAAPSVEVTVTAVRVVAPRNPDSAGIDCEIISDGQIVAENHTSTESTITCDATLT